MFVSWLQSRPRIHWWLHFPVHEEQRCQSNSRRWIIPQVDWRLAIIAKINFVTSRKIIFPQKLGDFWRSNKYTVQSCFQTFKASELQFSRISKNKLDHQQKHINYIENTYTFRLTQNYWIAFTVFCFVKRCLPCQRNCWMIEMMNKKLSIFSLKTWKLIWNIYLSK